VFVAIVVVKWVILILPVLVYLVIKLYKRSIGSIRETARVESNTKGPLLSFMGETFVGASTIRAFQKQHDFLKTKDSLLDNNISASRMVIATSNWFSMRIGWISLSMLSFSTIFCVMLRDQDNKVFMALLFSYILLLNDFVLWTATSFAFVEQRMVSVDRCLKILDIPQENMDGDEDKQDFFIHREDWPENGRIVFDRVNLRYRPNTEIILKDLSFDVKPREKIGVVGRTGAGKSTICLSLSRIVEIASGKITIDGINISDLPLNELRYRITVIPQVRVFKGKSLQDPTMFTGTLRFNLDPEEEVSDYRIE
jgi:ABC-type multidrug transport system fused ATPase/permease subunit